MSLFGGRSQEDREHLLQTLRSLGPTSVHGLSAALSWPPRRTEKVVRAAAQWGRGAIDYDPATGRVALRTAPSTAPTVSRPAAPTAAATPAARPAPPPLPKAWNASPKCPACSVPFVSTGTGSGVYCPNCGRLALRDGAAPPPAAAAATAPEPAATTPSVTTRHGPATTLGDDRHSQELFAAWVTSRPLPCPKCRTSLRHKGVGQYACPACGAQVHFEGPAPSGRSGSAATAAPAPSAASAPSPALSRP